MDDVIVPNTYTVAVASGTNAACRSLTVNSGGTVSVNNGGSLNVTGLATVDGSLSFTGGGAVGSLSGNGTFAGVFGTDNSSTTFSGTLTNATKTGNGTTTLTKTGAVATQLTVVSGTIRLNGANIFDDATSSVTLDGGTLDLNSRNETVPAIAAVAGNGTVLLGSGTLTISTSGTVSYDGTISGVGGVTKAGTGTLRMLGISTYTGATTISGGTIECTNFGIPDDTSVVMSAGCTLTFAGAPLPLKIIGSLSGAGTVSLGGVLQVGTANNQSTFSGTIQDRLEKVGTGPLTLSGSVSSTQPVTIRAGVLVLGASNVLNASSTLDIFSGAVLDMSNSSQTLAGLTGQGQIRLGDGSANALTINSSTNGQFMGDIDGTDTADQIIKQGTGTLTLSGTNSFRGSTTVSAGSLQINGTFQTLGTMTVGAAGTIGGGGFAGNLQVSGTINPGPTGAAGTLIAGGATFNSASTLSIDIPSTAGSDLLSVSAPGTISTGAIASVNLTGYASATPRIFKVLSCSGGLTGTFTTLNVTGNGTGMPVFLTYTTNDVFVSVGQNLPVVDLNGPGPGSDFSASFTEGSPPAPAVDAMALTVSDPDNTTLASASVQITNLQDGAAESLQANTAGTAITAAYNSGTGTLTLSGVDQLPRYQTVLRTVTYSNSSTNPGTTARVITFIANDGVVNGPAATTTMAVVAVNNPPIVDLNGAAAGTSFAATFTEDGGAIATVAATATLSDDNANLASATVTIANLLDTGLETLAANTGGTAISASYNGAGVLTLSGSDSVANYQQVLRSVTYINVSQNPTTTARSINFVCNDGTQNSTAVVSTITVLSVDDVPSFTKGADQTVLEDSGARTVVGWATAISPGPAQEVSQSVTFLVTNDNSALFAVQPAVAANGTLTFTPGVDKNGSANVSVRIMDNGGTANGGIDTSAAQTFKITVTAVGESFVVVNTADAGAGSLRDCMQRAGAGDTITFDIAVFDLTNSDAATLINVNSPLPVLSSGSVTIDAQDRRVTVNGSAAGNSFGIDINSNSNNVRGLAIVGFTKSGISIRDGAKNNVIGGSRSVGTGPNGQGLRIASCGAFGVEISGSGTDSNAVKGCWIGLDKSGEVSQANLAGILIQGGAKNNTIGSTVAAEANIIGGNAFEGVTVSGTGSDDNVIVGNFVGTGASANPIITSRANEDAFMISRCSNGSSGMFLSRGTQRTKVGGTATGEGNAVGHNGGSGVEVRATTSKRNVVRANRISQNKASGIALFDGSNNGVKKPTIDSVQNQGIATRGLDAGSRALTTLTITGTASGEGTVELFNDTGTQGSTPRGRVTVSSNGGWRTDLDMDATQNITATYTDNDGNTSEFQVRTASGTPLDPSGVSTTNFGADTDGDGVADYLEKLAGSDPALAADVPVDGGTLGSLRFQASFNFAATGRDQIRTTLTFAPEADVVLNGATVAVAIGNFNGEVVLDANGKSPRGSTTVRVKQTGITYLQFTAKGDFLASFTATALTDRTTKNEVVRLPAAVIIKTDTLRMVIEGEVVGSYTATQGKKGTVKLAR